MGEPIYCGECRRALNIITVGGEVAYQHTNSTTHLPVPVPLREILDPLLLCDFCSSPDPVWAYRCDELKHDLFGIKARYYSVQEYRDKNAVARPYRTESGYSKTSILAEGWAACAECAEFVEEKNINSLVRRVAESMPAKLTRGKRLAEVRGRLFELYGDFFRTLKPGRVSTEEAAKSPDWREQ